MEASDLQVGDLVTNNGDVIKVSAVHTKKIGYHKTKNKLNWLFSGQFEPIPLTPEILEKNGFKKDKDYGYFIGQSNSGYYIYLDNNYLSIQAGYDAIEFAWCEYVHELQHALKLCGIKKEIVI